MSASLRKPWSQTPALAAETPVWTAGVAPVDASAPRSQPEAWREAVGLWLQWNSAYEQVTQQLYEQSHAPHQLEAIMDNVDQIRHRAVRLCALVN